ncbi:hypothetical protein [Brevibacterium litoralis]|uniref:hypothetical protein n=1 Tax=Brevibacterium litoralis TaxID=3138935 RepID=UPI0032EABC25
MSAAPEPHEQSPRVPPTPSAGGAKDSLLIAWAKERTRADPGFELADVQRRVDRQARERIGRNRYGARSVGERVQWVVGGVLVVLAWLLPVIGFSGLMHADGYYQFGQWRDDSSIPASFFVQVAVLALVSSLVSSVYVLVAWARAGFRWYPPHAGMTVYLVIADVLMIVLLTGPVADGKGIEAGPLTVGLAWVTLVVAGVAFLCQVVTAGRRRIPGSGVDWDRLHPRDEEELIAERNTVLDILFDKRMLREYDREDLKSRPVDGLV